MPDLKRLREPRLVARAGYTLALAATLMILIVSIGGTFTGGKSLLINEVMPSNRCTIEDEDGDYPDWFEIYNPSDQAVNMKGYFVTNDSNDPFMWAFPTVTIEPGGYLVVFASGKDRAAENDRFLHTNFRLSASGCDLLLIDPEATVIDSVTVPEIYSNVSYGRPAGNLQQWAFFLDATPGAANEAAPFEQVTDLPRAEAIKVYINEFLTANRTSIPDEDGDLSDWIEIHNPGPVPVNLDRYWLSDKDDNPFKWRFPALTLEPGGHLVLFASGKNRRDPGGPYLHTNFRLNDRDDTLVFSTPEGARIDEIRIRNMERDVSYGRDPEDPGRWLYFPRPTPGEPNYSQGFEEFSGGRPVPRLVISEAMAVNVSTIPDEDGDYSDWIEIYNREGYPVNLEGYGLSDREDNPFRWEFPEATIEPGEHLIVFASGKDRRSQEEGYLHTNFKIQATGETLVLSHPSGQKIDRMPTGMLGPDLSIGRLPHPESNSIGAERHFFKEATPGRANDTEPYSAYAAPLLLSHPGGFYEEPLTLTVTAAAAAGNAEIRYSLDGSEPQPSSELYSGPIKIERTSVFRARAFEEGKLPGPVENRTFFIAEEHNLTVLSVLMNPRDLWDQREGIYVRGYGASEEFPYRGANFWKDMETPIHFELYEPGGTPGLSLDAGIKIGGQYSRTMDQKIFNVFFRNVYGYNEIHYPLFPRKNLTSFKALTLRTSGQDAIYSKIRDILMTSLLEETGLDYQDHRQAVLYLNGEYWGIYNLRERANRHFIADNHGLDPDKIDLLQANWIVRAGSNEDYLDLLRFARANDLSKSEHYDYIKTRMDVNNYIDALIAQIYYGQTDAGNIRYWREQGPEGKWRWLVFDFDWCFWLPHLHYNTLASFTNPAGTGVEELVDTTLTVRLMRNPDFRAAFVERFAYHLNHTFEPERVIARIEELAANIEPEMPRHIERWGGSMRRWQREIEDLKEFARRRPAIVTEHIRRHFRLSDGEMEIFDLYRNR